MSRIGKIPVSIPAGVETILNGKTVTMKSKSGELSYTVENNVSIKFENGEISVTRDNEEREARELHGLTRTLINNMVVGLTTGYSKSLDIVGVGYKVEVKGIKVIFSLGHSHPIYFYPPKGISVTADAATRFTVKGIDKELVGQVAAKLRSFRPPEPYKGKGVKYSDEVILRKAGKSGKKK
jgi:large subunit ribosomal protein L6